MTKKEKDEQKVLLRKGVIRTKTVMMIKSLAERNQIRG